LVHGGGGGRFRIQLDKPEAAAKKSQAELNQPQGKEGLE
jgi:hypothetical protein